MTKSSEYSLGSDPMSDRQVLACTGCIFNANTFNGIEQFGDGATCLISHLQNRSRLEAIAAFRLKVREGETDRTDTARISYESSKLTEFSCKGARRIVVLTHKLTGETVNPEEVVSHYKE